MVIPSGQLVHPDGKLTIKKHTYAKVAGGGYSDTESTVTTRNARVEPLSTEDLLEAERVGEQLTHRITMRYDSVTKGVTGNDHWFEQGSRTFEIVGSGMDTDERHRELQFKCKERKSG